MALRAIEYLSGPSLRGERRTEVMYCETSCSRLKSGTDEPPNTEQQLSIKHRGVARTA